MSAHGWRPRLVATDLDGTLVRSDGTISERSRRALAAVEAAGVHLVLVTGRPPRWLAPIVAATGHRGVAICANGAIVYDLHAQRVLRTEPLPVAVIRDLVSALRAAVPEVAFAVEGEKAFGHEPVYRPGWPDPGALVAELDDLLREPRMKVLAKAPDHEPDAFLRLAREVVGGAATLTHSSTSALVEISAAGVTKASALARLAAEHRVSAEAVLAFGDMPNDLPLMAWAGYAVAVANAHPDVAAAAAERTASNDDDGVAQVLERWFPG